MDIRLIMGSTSDIEVAKKVTKMLKKFDLSYEVSVISAHRALDVLKETVEKDDCKVYITIAGKAAHLGGVTAGITTKPVIGIPVKGSALAGMDALYSIVQMPKGVPVATVAVNGAENAAILAVQILAIKYDELAKKLEDYKLQMRDDIVKIDAELNK